jgi:hypothetical protein
MTSAKRLKFAQTYRSVFRHSLLLHYTLLREFVSSFMGPFTPYNTSNFMQDQIVHNIHGTVMYVSYCEYVFSLNKAFIAETCCWCILTDTHVFRLNLQLFYLLIYLNTTEILRLKKTLYLTFQSVFQPHLLWILPQPAKCWRHPVTGRSSYKISSNLTYQPKGAIRLRRHKVSSHLHRYLSHY